jgi:hypothetical protein
MDWSILQNSAWIGVAGTLLGALAGGAMVVGTKWFEFWNQNAENRRVSLEDLHYRIQEYEAVCADFTLGVLGLSRESGRPNEDDMLQLGAALRRPLPKIRSLQRIYAPDLAKEFVRLLNTVGDVYEATLPMVGRGAMPTDFRKKLNQVRIACENCSRRLEDKIDQTKSMVTTTPTGEYTVLENQD